MRRWGLLCLAVLAFGALATIALAVDDGVTADPSTLTFEQDVTDGTSAQQISTVTNAGADRIVTSVEGPTSAAFQVQSDNPDDCAIGSTLTSTSGETCTVRVRFTPAGAGITTDSVTVHTTDGDATVGLSGTGTERTLSAAPDALSFGDQSVGTTSTSKLTTITNTGTGPVTLGAPSIGGTDAAQFELDNQTGDCATGTILQPADHCDIHVEFAPATAGSTTDAHLTVPSNAPGLQIVLGGTATEPVLGSDSAAFSFRRDVGDGTSPARVMTITNTGSEPVPISSVEITGADSGDFANPQDASDDCKNGVTNLAVGGTCKVRVTFDPSNPGSGHAATATVHSTAPDVSIALSGDAVQTDAAPVPSTLAFGKQDLGANATAPMTSTITNAGPDPLTLTGIDLTAGDTGDFAREAVATGDCTGTTTLNAGAHCDLRYTFDPSTRGAKSATVTVTSDAAADMTLGLTGEGTETVLTRSPAGTVGFGSRDVDAGAAATQAVTLSNAGTEPIAFATLTVSGHGFSKVSGTCSAATTLTEGQSCTVGIAFDPSLTGDKTGELKVTSGVVPDLTVPLSGRGIDTKLSRSPAGTVAFGSRDIDGGATATQTVTVSNAGTEPVTFSGLSVTGHGFSKVSGTCTSSTTLTEGQSCAVGIAFDPSLTGDKTGELKVTSGVVPDLTVPLSGRGIDTLLTGDPATHDFGNRDIDEGPSDSSPVTIKNSGTEVVTLNGVDVTGDFAQVGGAGTNCDDSAQLAENDECTVYLQFEPTATGTRTGTLTVTAPGGVSVSVDLSGTGTQTAIASNVPSISAGSQDVDDGPTTTQQATLTNSGTEPVSLASVTLGGANAGEFDRLTGNANDCGAGTALTAAQTCKVRVRFDPSSTGNKSARVTISGAGLPAVTIDLSGRGVQTALSREPSALDLGSHPVGSGATGILEANVTNTGTEPLTLETIRLLDPAAARFYLVTGTDGDCAAGRVLPGGETCKLRAMFVPQSVGEMTGTVVFTSPLGEATVVLTARGTPAPTLTIPSFSARASSTSKKRLKVPIRPLRGTIRNIVVDVRSRGGRLLGTGRLASAGRARTAVVKLKKPLSKGRYVAKARGRNAFGTRVDAKPRTFRLR